MLRAERSGARTTEGAGWKWRAPGGRFGEGMVGICFLLLIDMVPVPAWVHLRRRVSAANTVVHWVGGELVPVYSSPGGDKDHERSEYRCILERQEFVAGVERQRNGG